MRTLRLIGVAAGLLLAGTSAATAADLQYGMKDEPVYPALWQGRYFGINLGASGAGVDVKGVGKHNEFDVDGAGFSGGLLVGYNFRNGSWVGGFEADINGAAFEDSKTVAGLGKVTLSSHANGSLRVRGGYAWDRVLLYATGGIGFSEYNVKSSLGGDEGLILASPVLGLGAEIALDQNWTARAEALAFGVGSTDITLAGDKYETDLGYSSLRVGLTRRF